MKVMLCLWICLNQMENMRYDLNGLYICVVVTMLVCYFGVVQNGTVLCFFLLIVTEQSGEIGSLISGVICP